MKIQRERGPSSGFIAHPILIKPFGFRRLCYEVKSVVELKFVYSEKATKFYEISTNFLS